MIKHLLQIELAVADSYTVPHTAGGAASEIVFEHEQNKGVNAQRYGMSLKNNDGGVQPCLYAPQFGTHSTMTADEDYTFVIGLYAGNKPLFDAYREICREEYGYRDYRRNIFGCNLVVGRYTTYPGYYNRMFCVQHMRPDYPYQGPTSGSMIYYHHIPVQLGMTMDFLITEAITRSDGHIDFPGEFEAAYVWLKYRLFGHKPGSFYGTPNAWLWMPKGIVSTDNYLVNWITAESGDKFHISLTNSSQSNETVTVSLNDAIIGFDTGTDYALTIVADNGAPRSAVMRNGRFTVDVSPKGITAVTIGGMNIDVPLHDDFSVAERDTSNASYWFDSAPFGQVRGMLLLKPDKSSYNAYIQTDVHSASEPSATLRYSNDGGKSYAEVVDSVYPFEWSIRVEDLSKSFIYSVSVPSGAKSKGVPLWLPTEYDGPPLRKPDGTNHAARRNGDVLGK